jgi:hypothetical protein
MQYPSVDVLKQEVNYDEKTGVFSRLKTHPKLKYRAGDITGVLTPAGYLQISIRNKIYLAHRLAWLYVYGVVPSKNIDHIDGVKTNNAINNLRELSQKNNVQNIKKAKVSNKLGILGVSVANKGKGQKSYRSRIVVDGKEIHLGVFEKAEDAREAYLVAKRKYHYGCTI